MNSPTLLVPYPGRANDKTHISCNVAVGDVLSASWEYQVRKWAVDAKGAYDDYAMRGKRLFPRTEGALFLEMAVKDILAQCTTMEALRSMQGALHKAVFVSRDAGRPQTCRVLAVKQSTKAMERPWKNIAGHRRMRFPMSEGDVLIDVSIADCMSLQLCSGCRAQAGGRTQRPLMTGTIEPRLLGLGYAAVSAADAKRQFQSPQRHGQRACSKQRPLEAKREHGEAYSYSWSDSWREQDSPERAARRSGFSRIQQGRHGLHVAQPPARDATATTALRQRCASATKEDVRPWNAKL
ncbi:uncharacterized protein LOC119376172 [Rhipicephalus sanguineus]|uniref:uncharacterized protein LOC119376172 n=1 Tax=Rhipicephalus sanguineus TaxID=34632 RepID=UPI0020C3EF70|nr:uncharacterized protein LOC119376172 [Rhipicephalus sanguineus]